MMIEAWKKCSADFERKRMGSRKHFKYFSKNEKSRVRTLIPNHMNDKEIINALNHFYKSISSDFPNLDKKIRNVFLDLNEVYEDFVFKNENLDLKKLNYPNELKFDNIITLINLIIKFSNEKDYEKLQYSLTNLEITLEHSQNHLKQARRSLKSIINQIGKKYSDDEE